MLRTHPTAKFGLEDLAERVARQFVDEFDDIGALDAGELVAAERNQLRRVSRVSACSDDEGVHLFAPFRIGSRHHAASRTPGCQPMTSSTSRLEMLAPPLMIRSFLRSTM